MEPMEHPFTVLIVDDEPDVVEILSYNLTKAGFLVISSTNGSEALKMISKHKPDLILLDIRMPEMDGIQVCRTLKLDENFRSTPVIFLTADSDEYTNLNAFSVGADQLITKPIHPKLVVSIVEDLLHNKKDVGV